ncbi:MAG TPA: serine/threonine-protein kinase [Pirellulaceae bacterium]|nr:serine/threonine-protein kinase [Pirellulaceae bacterium]HMO92222.1 serine/threonine-protein kinase [Pirellulaceae bacterium]HMP69395.1 serine/threonine-protein kinase [Pirellulaceae bacterium]
MNEKSDELRYLVDDFDIQWSNGGRPSIVDWLDKVELEVQPDLLRLLIPIDVEYRTRLGELPQVSDYDAIGEVHRQIVHHAFANPTVEETGLDQTLDWSEVKLGAPTLDLHRSQDQTDDRTSQTRDLPNNLSTAKPMVVGQFEILSEIARGGMGVVYRALDKKLNRIVAIKKILTGDLASEEEISRFRFEAESAASLDHPAITPIYEIGNHEGTPFFAMKLIEGSSLQNQLSEYEQDTQQAIRLLATVARGVHHAHQRGILHRDLKPANILLDRTGRPFITDFGLAKQSNSGVDLTRSGAILGTPAYMAPEQGMGRGKTTTATDIYSIGAILYRLLTGRTTYIADSPIEMLMQLLHDDPVPPRKIKSTIPADLELICLKCLARDPQQRYQSAAEIADDMERWMEGEPISVRAASITTLAGVWFRQNMRMASSAAIVGTIAGLMLAVLAFIGIYASHLSFARHIHQHYFASTAQSSWGSNWIVPAFFFPISVMLWPLIVALCGFFTVVFTRPQSRSMAGSAGMIAGVICGGLFGIAGTLGPILSFTQKGMESDMQLLAQMGSEDDSVRNYAKATIAFRYQKMKEQPAEVYADLLYQKVKADLIYGLPVGLWTGMAVFMLAAPAVVLGSIVAFSLTRESTTYLGPFIRYVDIWFAGCLVLTILILFVISSPLQAGIYIPEWGFGTVIMSSLILAFAAAVRQWNWKYRIPIHIAWISMVVWYVTLVAQGPTALKHAAELVVAGDYSAAVGKMDLELRIPRSNSAMIMNHYRAGLLNAKLNRPEQYRHHSLAALTLARSMHSAEDVERAAKLCLAGAEAQSEWTAVLRLFEQANEVGKLGPYRQWFLLTEVLGLFRSERWDEVIQTARKLDREFLFLINCSMDMLEAMAVHNLGDTDKAKQMMLAADSWCDEAWNYILTQEQRELYWHERLLYELLREEARQKIMATR